ncbi:DEHA2D05654p [Debaryomyces hansenii CBS767]|uniref:DEHA2D05654p n=1 Tax=Debaryomyces hansenii (strain ATCC 36239 / CBS 767 / BCRC 21394 / JCM 1990 / NBRC 0083 / IGC 2968) TaxID=284592 RepID=B5RTR5_DEBHA|nr:DEHA2D05654p [Debaryomyces hansenii CBS767]CAR65621.1 DEHA2D05654p [Debaryomyces hansenii CBS767]|eukprot:XP_002770265.1 DEHA2D05654p [Debaryomyces hansenii CBS767]
MDLIDNLQPRGGNEAVSVNRPGLNTDIHLTNHGSSWLWAVFSIFATLAVVHAFVFSFTSSRTHRLKKILFIVPLFTNAIMAYCYFTYAANLGWTSTRVEFNHVSTNRLLGVRQVFYVKYIGWFLAWPFVLFAIEVATHTLESTNLADGGETVTGILSLLSGLIVKTFATEIYVLGLLIGILIPSSYRWGYFTFAVSAQLFAMSLILVSMFSAAKSVHTNKAAIIFIAFQLLVWILYPICWGLSEGGNRIQPDSEAVFYGILDLITFSFVPIILTWINASGVDEDFFHKVMHLNLRRNSRHEKPVEETPRHSGDTAVPLSNSDRPEVEDNVGQTFDRPMEEERV